MDSIFLAFIVLCLVYLLSENQPSSGSKMNLNTGSSSNIIRRPSSGRRKRMRPVAHYDAQSIPLGVDSLMLHRGATTERLASGASSAHNSEELGSGKENDLVQLCSKFVNEIGGEWFLEEKDIGIVRQSLPKHMRYKVRSVTDSTAQTLIHGSNLYKMSCGVLIYHL